MAENKDNLKQWAAKVRDAMLRNLGANSQQADKIDEEAFQRSRKAKPWEPGRKTEEEIEEIE